MDIELFPIVHYLDLKGLKPKEIQIDINTTFQYDAIAYSTITKYLREKNFTSTNQGNIKNKENFEENFRIQLILRALKDYPFSSTRAIADITGVPKSTVFYLLTTKLQYKIKHLHYVPHFLNSIQKKQRKTLSKSLLTTLEKERKRNFDFLFTGDESWFYLSCDHDQMWLYHKDQPPDKEKVMISTKKYMVTIFWNPNGFHIVEMLESGERFNSEYFINRILHPLYLMTSGLRKNYHRKLILHFDNARPHTSRKVQEYMSLHKMKRAPHPPYSPDIAPSDFFLFAYIKKQLKGSKFQSPDDLKDAIHEILNQIDKGTLLNTFTNWSERLQKVIDTDGDFC